MKNLIWSFSPWVAFLLGVRVGGVYWGAGIGLAVALVVLVRALGRHSTHMFDVTGCHLLTGVCSRCWPATHPSDIATWGRYAQAVAHGSLTLITVRFRSHREALHGALRTGAGSRAGVEDRPVPRSEPTAVGGVGPGLSRGHDLADHRRVAGLASVRVAAGGPLRCAAPRLHVQPEAGQRVRQGGVSRLTRHLPPSRTPVHTEQGGARYARRIRNRRLPRSPVCRYCRGPGCRNEP